MGGLCPGSPCSRAENDMQEQDPLCVLLEIIAHSKLFHRDTLVNDIENFLFRFWEMYLSRARFAVVVVLT